jgi:hypothetical protein
MAKKQAKKTAKKKQTVAFGGSGQKKERKRG